MQDLGDEEEEGFEGSLQDQNIGDCYGSENPGSGKGLCCPFSHPQLSFPSVLSALVFSLAVPLLLSWETGS
jgi:hypothetical protein